MANGEMKMASSAQGTPKKKLDHIRVKPAKNGGHTVEHHYQNSGMVAYTEPDIYAFGSGPETMSHLNDHLGVSENKKISHMKAKGSYDSEPGGKADHEMAEKEPTVHQGNRRTKAERRGEN